MEKAASSRGTSKGPADPGRSDSCHLAIGSGISTCGADTNHESSRKQHCLDNPREYQLAEPILVSNQVRSYQVYRLYDKHRDYDRGFASRIFPLEPTRPESPTYRATRTKRSVLFRIFDIHHHHHHHLTTEEGEERCTERKESEGIVGVTCGDPFAGTEETWTRSWRGKDGVEGRTREAKKSLDPWLQRCGAFCSAETRTDTRAIATGIIRTTNPISRVWIIGVVVNSGKATVGERRRGKGSVRVATLRRGPSTGTIDVAVVVAGANRGR